MHLLCSELPVSEGLFPTKGFCWIFVHCCENLDDKRRKLQVKEEDELGEVKGDTADERLCSGNKYSHMNQQRKADKDHSDWKGNLVAISHFPKERW